VLTYWPLFRLKKVANKSTLDDWLLSLGSGRFDSVEAAGNQAQMMAVGPNFCEISWPMGMFFTWLLCDGFSVF
jgi:hypothetical protein